MLEFLKTKQDKCKYALLYQIVGSTECEYYTDNENYFMARSDKQHAIWIWSKEDLNKNAFNDLKNAIEKFLICDETIKFTCSQELYYALKEDDFKYLTDDYFEMGTYLCTQTKKPISVNGNFRLAKNEEIELLSKYHKDEMSEIEKIQITMEQSQKDIEVLMYSPNKDLYVWEDESKKIVCMAAININEQFARINYVYTPKDERCKNYAKNLICSLTQIALDKNMLPVLYTNYNYPASNKAYMSVGYESCGVLINFSCKKSI